MFTQTAKATSKFVLLRGVLEENYFDKFFSDHHVEQDPTKLLDGRIAYRILGYAETVEEAQVALYGRSYK